MAIRESLKLEETLGQWIKPFTVYVVNMVCSKKLGYTECMQACRDYGVYRTLVLNQVCYNYM